MTKRFHHAAALLALPLALAALLGGCGRDAASRVDAGSPALAAAPAARTAPAPAAGPLVVFLGDSLTAGLGLEQDQAYPALLGERLARAGDRVRVLNAGVSGDRTEHLLWRLQHGHLAGASPKVAVLTIGTNDIGYAAYGGLCIQGDCSGAPTRAVAAELPDLAKRIGQLFQDIHARSPHAKIVLSAYGSQLSPDANADGKLDPICDASVFSAQERTDGNALARQLNKTLRDTVVQAEAAGIDAVFVSEYAADSVHLNNTFAGHSLCQAGTPFYRGFDALAPGQEGPDAVLHLNKDGQTALADLIMTQV